MFLTFSVMFNLFFKSSTKVFALIFCIIVSVLPVENSFSQSNTCVPGMVMNGNNDNWSEECYLTATCQEQGNPCQANDVSLLGVYLADINGDPLPTCQVGMTTTVYLWGSLSNNTMTNRRAIRTRTEIWLNGVFNVELNTCSFDVLPPGVTDVALLGSFTYTCGQSLALINTWIGWETANNATCANTTVCGDYPPSKCSKNFGAISFLSPNFSYACGVSTLTTTEVCFNNLTNGGTPPYTYKWYFGDGDSSSLANPCHIYNATSGSFLVELFVTDNVGIVAGSFLTINLDSLVCCTLDITCPNSFGGIFSCKTLIPAPATDTTAFKNLGGVINDFCGTLTLTHKDSTNMAQGCIGDTFILYRTYKLKDMMNDSVLCTILYRVVDNVLPTIVCPINVTINCEASIAPGNTGSATATDNCTNTVTNITFSDTRTNGSCNDNYSLARLWSATDSCGNTRTCTQTITVQDTTRPVITCPINVTINCEASIAPGNTGSATATDNCTNTVTNITFSDTRTNGSCNDNYSLARLWSATDSCGNTRTCTQTITVQDTTRPVITCPVNVTINCEASIAPGNTGSATATDNCTNTVTNITSSDTRTNGSCNDNYSLARLWTATDSCGNTSTCTQTITVQDTTRPVITCPANVTINCEASTLPANTGSATATDNCTNTITNITSSDTRTNGSCNDNYSLARLWTATDSCGNTSTCTQTITVQDTTRSVITCPANVTINCEASIAPGNTGSATATDNCTNTVTNITFSDTRTNGSCNDNYSLARLWTATDSCGNTSTCTQTITVQDTTRSVITCPANVTINCEASTLPANTGSATATDNCTNTVTNITSSDTRTNGSCNDNYSLARLWTATDSCGNTSTCTQTITVQDTTRPVITCPANVTINCEASIAPGNTGSATATDNCTNTVTNISSADIRTNGSCNDNYIITRTWTAVDSCNNGNSCVQTINVQDTTRPAIVCPINITFNCDAITTTTFTGTASATDNCTNTVTNISSSDARTDGNCNDNYVLSRTWTAVDSCNNTNSCVQTITVQDTTRPVIVCPINVTINCEASTAPLNTGTATATDNCTNTVTNISSADVRANGSCNDNYVIARTWTAVDSCNNSNSCVQTITVQDTSRPAIVCPINVTINCEASTLPSNTGTATATDNCTNTVTNISSADVRTNGSCNNNYILARAWTVVDSCNNNNSCVQTITVQDTTRPVIVCPINVTINCEASTLPSNTGTATVTDNCTNTVTNISSADVRTNGSCNDNYVLARTWTSTDSCNNSNSCVQTITVQDTTRPVIVCPINVTFNCEASTTPTFTGNATATDNCTNTVTNISSVDIRTNGSCNDNYVLARTWTAVDSCNNINSCVQTITVQDTTRPVMVCPINITINCEANTDPANTGTATATDNCTNTITNISSADVRSNGSCNDNYLIARTWTAVDSCNNSNSCVQKITVQDTMRPAIVCPINVTINCEASTLPTNTGTATAMDNCTNTVTNISSADVRTNGSCNDNYVLARTWTAVDSCNNSNSCDQTITVQDTTRPVIVCPINVTINCEASTAPSNTGSAAATDNCTNTVTNISSSDMQTIGICEDSYTINRTWTIYDECLNSNTCLQVIFVQDTTRPTALCKDFSTHLSEMPDLPILIDSVNNGSFDNCDLTPTLTLDMDTIFCENIVEMVMVTLLVSDNCSNMSSCISTVTIIDTVPPLLECPENFTIDLTGCVCYGEFQLPNVLPNECSDLIILERIDNNGIEFDSIPEGTHLFILQATDVFGQVSTCEFEITVIQGINLPIACIKHINLSLGQDCNTEVTPNMILADRSCENHNYKLELKDSYGQVLPTNILDNSFIGKKIIAQVTSKCYGNFCWSEILIEDKLGPQIECLNDTMSCVEYSINGNKIKVIEECSKYDSTLLGEVHLNTSGDPNFIKKIIQTWSATDIWGNTGNVCTREILIERINLDDIDPPREISINCDEIRLDSLGNISPSVTGTPILNGISIYPVQDFFCNYFVNYEDYEIGEESCVRRINRTWTVREWWNGTEITRIFQQLITVTDNKGPDIAYPIPDFEVTTGSRSCAAIVKIPSIVAIDDCHNPIRIDILFPGGIVINQNGATVELPIGYDTIVYRVYDGCYNLTQDTLIITVKDQTEPVAVCDRRTVVAINSSGMNWIPAEVFDDGSFDECKLHHLEVRRMDANHCGSTGNDDFGPEVQMCCEDVGLTIMVALRVVDYSGNSNQCMVMVEVQDKNPPRIVCPPHIDIDCRFGIDINNLGNSFGNVVLEKSRRDTIVIDPRFWHEIYGHPFDGIVYDNCSPNVIETIDTSGMNQCGMGLLIRKFLAIDAQGSRDSCTQQIRIDNHFPMSEISINWPDDFEATNICDANQLRPELLEYPYNIPTFIDDECSMVGLDYEDHIFSSTIPGEPCYKIFREWKVIDWCYRDRLNNIVIFRDTQIIKVINTIDPVITKECRDTTICSYSVNCDPIPVTLSISATDICTNSNELLFRYKIDLNSDGTFDINVANIGNPVASGTWPIGRHIIKWEVEDRCGNTATCQSQLNLLNCKPPTAYAHKDLAIGLTGMDTNGDGVPDTKMAIVWASDLDAGSNHNCGYPIKFSFSSDTNDTRRVYTCDSIGPRNVELWVTDPNGNTSFVKTLIIINDNPQQDPVCPGRATAKISGLIHSANNNMIEQVEVNLDKSNFTTINTNYDGAYSFGEMVTGGDYVIRPYLNEDWLNGVSTADIVRIQKHILGKELINSPYHMIAADVNNSKSITSADISELRKLILGLTNQISKNTSWRFVKEQFSFGPTENTLTENFPETYEIKPLNTDISGNFIGIKIGDLTDNAKTRGVAGISTRNSNVLDLNFENRLVSKDEVVEIKFYSNNITEFLGMQMTLDISPTKAEIIDLIGNIYQGFGDDNFNLTQQLNGRIPISWNNENSFNDKSLFTLTIKSKVNAKIGDLVSINSRLTESLSVDKHGEEGTIQLRTVNNLSSDFIVMQNEPNPWKYSTTFGFVLPSKGEVNLTVYDLNGRVYYKSSRLFEKGFNSWNLGRKEIGGAGVYYYQLDFETNTKTNKMIIID